MDTLLHIELAFLYPDPTQPRKDFNKEQLQELADSIKAVGVRTPITVRPHPSLGQNHFMIVSGERRWRASRLAGAPTVPAVLESTPEKLTEDAIWAHQVSENMHRENLNPIEWAEFVQERIEVLRKRGEPNPTELIAAELGMKAPLVSKRIACLKYSAEVRALVRDGRLRDYGLLKKIDSLKPGRKAEVIQLIEAGTFNSKEVFKRKRYDKPKSPSPETEAGQPAVTGSQTKPSKPKPVRMALPEQGWLKVIERTGFSVTLDEIDPDWRRAPAPIMASYFTKFRDWVTSDL